jgi:hypothetical protein
MPNVVDSDANRRDDLIFELIRDRVKGEWDRSMAVDGKAGNLIGFTSVVIGLLLSAVSLNVTILSQSSILSAIYFTGVGILLLSIFFSLMVIKIRAWTLVPDVKRLLDYYVSRSYQELLQSNAATMADAIKISERNNTSKARYTQYSWYFLLSVLCRR